MRSNIWKDIVGLTVVGLLLKIYPLNQSFWLDEATSVVKATTLSFKDLIFTFAPGDFHPPLYYLLLKVWISVFGNSEVEVRLLSVFFGLLSVAILYLIATKLFNRRTGQISGALLATSPLFFYYSQEARMYVMSTFLSLLVIWCFTQIVLKQTPKLFNWLAFVVSSVALIYTDYLPALTLLFCAAFLMLEKKSLEKHKTGWILSFLAIAISFTPWLPIFANQLHVGALVKMNAPIWWQTLGKANFKQVALVPVKFLIGRISFQNKLIYAAFVAFYAFEFGSSAFKSLRNYKKSAFVWLWFFIPLVAALVFGTIMSGFTYFRLLFLLPVFYLIVAHGLSTTIKAATGKICFRAGLNILAILVFVLNPHFWREDWKSAVVWIEQDAGNKNAATIFVTNNQRDPYYYYSKKKVPSYGPDGLQRGNFEKIYLMRYVQPIFDPQDNLRKNVEQAGYIKVLEKDFNGVTVWEYERQTYADLY